MDVGGKFAGTLSGSMNMMGNFAGGIAPVVIGKVLDATGNDFTVTFYISAAAYFLGALCWLGIDSSFCRSHARCTSTVRVRINGSKFHTSDSKSSRDTF